MPRRIAQDRHLRKAATPAERRLWSRLRNQQLYGYKFRRQHPVGDRIVDFFCHDAQLAIELDGSAHGYASRQAADMERASELLASGIRVIRFWNNEVLGNLPWVIEAILLQLDVEKSRWGRVDPPSPQSSPRGRGGRAAPGEGQPTRIDRSADVASAPSPQSSP